MVHRLKWRETNGWNYVLPIQKNSTQVEPFPDGLNYLKPLRVLLMQATIRF